MKQEIWLLATETSGPLVQRVSKNIMAVKCKASPKHPLGYLHFSLFVTKLKDRIEHRYFCSCSTFKVIERKDLLNSTISQKNYTYKYNCKFMQGIAKTTADKADSGQLSQNKRCVHFYACICAFASDVKLSEEFSYYINLDQSDLSIPKPLVTMLQNSEQDKIVGIGKKVQFN